jgi:hypothetical protein
MNTIEKDELYDNLRQFLKAKGVELQEGSYAQTIQKSCRILADVINMGQTGIERAKSGIDRKLDQVRQCIHDKTAPRPPKSSAMAGAAATAASTGTAETAEPAGAAVPKAAEAGAKANGTARKNRAPKSKSTAKAKASGKSAAKKKNG